MYVREWEGPLVKRCTETVPRNDGCSSRVHVTGEIHRNGCQEMSTETVVQNVDCSVEYDSMELSHSMQRGTGVEPAKGERGPRTVGSG